MPESDNPSISRSIKVELGISPEYMAILIGVFKLGCQFPSITTR